MSFFFKSKMQVQKQKQKAQPNNIILLPPFLRGWLNTRVIRTKNSQI